MKTRKMSMGKLPKTWRAKSRHCTTSRTSRFTSGCRGLPVAKSMSRRRMQRTRKATMTTTSGMTSILPIATYISIGRPRSPNFKERSTRATRRPITLKNDTPHTSVSTLQEVHALKASTAGIIIAYHREKIQIDLMKITCETSLEDRATQRTRIIYQVSDLSTKSAARCLYQGSSLIHLKTGSEVPLHQCQQRIQ